MEEVFKFYKVSWPNNSRRTVYEVSNMGRIRENGVIVQPKTFSTGYQRLGKELLHRIVAQLFIPNPDNKPEVDHINTDITDNRVDNLRWVSSSENTQNKLTLKHISEAQVGKHSGSKGPMKQSTKSRISNSVSEYYNDQAHREAQSIATKNGWANSSDKRRIENRNRYKHCTWVIDAETGKRIWKKREA